MSNLELTSVLEVAVFGLAIAQMLIILLTVRRERDIKDLRELVEEQRLRLTELRAWLAGRTSSQRMASDSKPDLEPTADAQASKSGMPLQEARSPEDDLARAAKALEWQREVAARLKSGISSQHATTPAEEDGFKWFRDDPNEPPEIVKARRVVNEKTHHPQVQNLPEDTATQPRSPFFEVERTLSAIKSLKEDTDTSSADLSREPRVNLK